MFWGLETRSRRLFLFRCWCLLHSLTLGNRFLLAFFSLFLFLQSLVSHMLILRGLKCRLSSEFLGVAHFLDLMCALPACDLSESEYVPRADAPRLFVV